MEIFSQQPNKADRVRGNIVLGVIAAVLVLASFGGGWYANGRHQAKIAAEVPVEGKLVGKNSVPPYALKDVEFKNFWNIWTIVKDKYVEKNIPDIKMYYGAVEGMVASLDDPYSVYFDPDTAKKFATELEGKFEGIGAEIGIKKNQLVVIAPLAGTPAERVGLKAGDMILEIDGTDTAGMPIEEAVSHIRGKGGTQVKLLIYREGMKEPKDYVITRDVIVIQAVKSKVEKVGDKKVAIITISSFNENAAIKFADAVRSVMLQDPDGLILDLRNDPGGFLDAAVDIAGAWIKDDVIVTEKFDEIKKEDYRSDGSAVLSDMPTVVLVNKGSASASEIVAGALQDYGKAKIIGETSYGKGSVQDYVEFDDGSALKITIALWLTPKGRTINKEGIKPDEEVKLTPEDLVAEKDPQMERAKQLIIDPNSPPPKPSTTATSGEKDDDKSL